MASQKDCSFCLENIPDDREMLTCGHGFCQQCSDNKRDSICPICGINPLTPITSSCSTEEPGPDESLFDNESNTGNSHEPYKCTSCDKDTTATMSCEDCRKYMCPKCTSSHGQLSIFQSHRVVPMRDNKIPKQTSTVTDKEKSTLCNSCTNGQVAVGYCKGCKLYVCQKCQEAHKQLVCLVDHHIIPIIKLSKVKQLLQRSTAKMQEVNEKVASLRSSQNKVSSLIGQLEQYARQLTKNRENVITQLKSASKGFTEDFASTQNELRKKVKAIEKCINFLSKENDTFSESELDRVLKYCSDLEELTETHEKQDLRSHNSDTHPSPVDELPDVKPDIEGLPRSSGSKGPSGNEIYNVNSAHLEKTLPVFDRKNVGDQYIMLPHNMKGMGKASDNSVVVGYGIVKNASAHHINSRGEITTFLENKVRDVWDITVLLNEACAVSHRGGAIGYYNSEGSPIRQPFQCRSKGSICQICSDGSDDIYAVYGKSCISVFPADRILSYVDKGSAIIIDVTVPKQICVSKNGTMIVSTCNGTTPNAIFTIDKDGSLGHTIRGNGAPASKECLYASIDDSDRVCVAKVEQQKAGLSVSLSRYTFKGTTLDEPQDLGNLILEKPLDEFPWCYLVCLAGETIAFAYEKHLHFIDLQKIERMTRDDEDTG